MNPKLHATHEQFPDIPARALDFFSPDNFLKVGSTFRTRTVSEFASHIAIPGRNENTSQHPPFHRLNLILQRMADFNALELFDRGGPMGMDASYVCTLEKDEKESIRSILNYIVYGFPHIYDALRTSIKPIVYYDKYKDAHIGTCFLLANRKTLVTAAHCVKGARSIAIRGIMASELERAQFRVSRNESIDLAAIRFDEPVLPEVPGIELGKAEILDDVMVMGYPSIPGFTDLLAAERANISSRLTVTRGAIASTATELFAKTELILITARVRGGFSGGPILNSSGLAVGVVSRQPISQGVNDSDGLAKYDELGYGVGIPSDEVCEFLAACSAGSNVVADVLSSDELTFREFPTIS